jgi:hypothetical protein
VTKNNEETGEDASIVWWGFLFLFLVPVFADDGSQGLTC